MAPILLASLTLLLAYAEGSQLLCCKLPNREAHLARKGCFWPRASKSNSPQGAEFRQ